MGRHDDDAPAGAAYEGWWRSMVRGRSSGPTYEGLGARVEKVLRLAQEEADEIRAAAARDAASIVEAAEEDAARIRAEAEADARAIRGGG